MTTHKRFTIQILGTADSSDSLTLHAAIEQALNGIDKCRVKAVNLDMWVDGFTGEPRKFDENGNEIVENVEINQTEGQTEGIDEGIETVEVEEVTA